MKRIRFSAIIFFALFFAILCLSRQNMSIVFAQDAVLHGTPNDLEKITSLLPEKLEEPVRITFDYIQPVDHTNPEHASFTQRVYVLHKGFDKPVVLWLEGYASRGSREQELSKILDANQITIEHRYFGQSRPDSVEWQYLTIEQAAADQHRVAQTFKRVYPGKWVSSGISKGGQTTMYHRRFYPDDVDVSVCYVGPLNFSSEDSRMKPFLESVGSEECREKILRFQLQMLNNKKDFLPLFEEYAKKKKYTFTMGAEAAYEYCVLEYPFSFWQFHYIGCDAIPASDASKKDCMDHFVKAVSPFYFSDQGVATFLSFFYQAFTQIGYYGYDTTPFGDLLSAVQNPSYRFSAPQGVPLEYDATAMQDIDEWIRTQGNNMIFIYGEIDPWSASAVQLNGSTNALKMVHKGGDHRTRIASFPDDERERILTTLENWLEIPVKREW